MSLLLRAALLADGRRVDVRVADGRIQAVADAGALAAAAEDEVLSLQRHLLLPAFAEPHAHLDKAYTAEEVDNGSADLSGAVRAWRAHRETLSATDFARRARRAALAALAMGATAIRTHVGGPGVDLTALGGVLAAREQLRGLVDIQIAAMGWPVVGPDAARGRADLRHALELGADVIGGVPHGESDPAQAIAFYLELAAEHGCAVDLHMDEHLRPEVMLAELARRTGPELAGRVTASHCVSLGMAPPAEQAELSAQLAAAGVAVVTCPATNLWLQGRDRPTATPRGLTALAALREAGVLVAGGGDNVQDPFNPLGAGDPLETAQLLVLAGQLPPDEALRCVGPNARAAMGLPQIAIAQGAPADLVAIGAPTPRQALATRTQDRIVIKAGAIVARTAVQAWIADDNTAVEVATDE